MTRYVCEENMCTGCMACKDICPAEAISVIDSIKAFNAVIHEDKCIQCGKCEKVCQNISQPVLNKPGSWCQGWTKDAGTRESSTSGGLATEIEKDFAKKGGVVCSCIFREGSFVFEFAKTAEEAGIFKGSKYVKSDAGGVYREIKRLLSDGQKVLFLGLPCQAAGLRNYCDDPGLYIVDIVCHGTPSPKVLDSFLKAYGVDIGDVKEISFRTGNTYGLRVDGRSFAASGIRDYYMFSFLRSLISTDNCYKCRYAQLSRVSDLTLGDAWGSELPAEVRKKGVSIALCQTDKGKELLENENLELMPIDLDKAVKVNTQLDHPSEEHKDRAVFLEGIAEGKKFTSIIRKLYPKKYCKNKIKSVLDHMGLHPGKNENLL